MSQEFQREDRYIVIKRKDLDTVFRSDVREQFYTALHRLNCHDVLIPQRRFLVIESDWPEYEPVWRMIEARMTGAPVPPAGGEPGAVEGLRQLVIGPYPNPDVEDAHDEYLDEHQPQALWLLRNAGRIETHVTRLQAENAALQQRLNVADQLVDDLETRAAELATAAGAVKACLELPDGRRAGWEARCLDLLRTVLPILHAPRELHRLQG